MLRRALADFTVTVQGDHAPRFQDSSGQEGWEVTCAETGLLAGTGARLKRVQDHVDTKTFMFLPTLTASAASISTSSSHSL